MVALFHRDTPHFGDDNESFHDCGDNAGNVDDGVDDSPNTVDALIDTTSSKEADVLPMAPMAATILSSDRSSTVDPIDAPIDADDALSQVEPNGIANLDDVIGNDSSGAQSASCMAVVSSAPSTRASSAKRKRRNSAEEAIEKKGKIDATKRQNAARKVVRFRNGLLRVGERRLYGKRDVVGDEKRGERNTTRSRIRFDS